MADLHRFVTFASNSILNIIKTQRAKKLLYQEFMKAVPIKSGSSGGWTIKGSFLLLLSRNMARLPEELYRPLYSLHLKKEYFST
jgi:hypothetical protein